MGKKKPVNRQEPVEPYEDEEDDFDDLDDGDRRRKDSGVRRHRSERSDEKADRDS